MRFALCAGLLLTAMAASPQTPPRSADDLLADAQKQAAGQREIWGIFHASW